jgi:glutamyl-tRNA synthetase
VRGQDLLNSTAAQLYLAKITSQNDFLATKFLHHPLIKDTNGNKLSKSEHAQCIHQMRQKGYTSEDVWIKLSHCLGWTNEPVTNAQDFAKKFNPDMFGQKIS